MEPLHLCVKSLHSWSWNVASSYSIIPRKLLLLSWIRLLCIKIQNYFFFFNQILFVVLTTPPCDILHCEFSSLNYHFIHLRLQLSINTVLPYSKGFHPLWRRNKTQIKQFCLLSLDDFFKSYSLSNEVCPVFIASFFCKSNFDFLLQSLLVLAILPIPWNYSLSC